MTRLLSFISNTQTRLHAAMGGQLTEGQKSFMAQYQDHDLASSSELQVKYNHVLSHHWFKGKEVTTTMDELKKTMKTDMAEIMVIDARAKTLQSLDKKESARAGPSPWPGTQSRKRVPSLCLMMFTNMNKTHEMQSTYYEASRQPP